MGWICGSNRREASRKFNNSCETCEKVQLARPRSRWGCGWKCLRIRLLCSRCWTYWLYNQRIFYLIFINNLFSTYLVHVYERHVMWQAEAHLVLYLYPRQKSIPHEISGLGGKYVSWVPGDLHFHSLKLPTSKAIGSLLDPKGRGGCGTQLTYS
jgi:hypothetical protein